MYSYLLSEWSRDSIYTRSLFIAVEHLFAAYQARRMSYLQPYSRYIVSLTLCCSGRSLHSRHDANQIGTNCQWQWAMGDGERYQWVGRYSYTHNHTHSDYLLIDCSKLLRLNLIAKGFICLRMCLFSFRALFLRCIYIRVLPKIYTPHIPSIHPHITTASYLAIHWKYL